MWPPKRVVESACMNLHEHFLLYVWMMSYIQQKRNVSSPMGVNHTASMNVCKYFWIVIMIVDWLWLLCVQKRNVSSPMGVTHTASINVCKCFWIVWMIVDWLWLLCVRKDVLHSIKTKHRTTNDNYSYCMNLHKCFVLCARKLIDSE